MHSNASVRLYNRPYERQVFVNVGLQTQLFIYIVNLYLHKNYIYKIYRYIGIYYFGGEASARKVCLQVLLLIIVLVKQYIYITQYMSYSFILKWLITLQFLSDIKRSFVSLQKVIISPYFIAIHVQPLSDNKTVDQEILFVAFDKQPSLSLRLPYQQPIVDLCISHDAYNRQYGM